MSEAPEPVLLFIPLMVELGMSWKEIMSTPRFVLEGLLMALMEHKQLHSMDGYTDKDISQMAKDRPQVRSSWITYMEKKRKYYKGAEERTKSFRDIL
jgi:hypothetical protein|tara:strand:- start:2223 stop:2513 length:291 start_codon:yes stop_codon:yes gene_type:complete